MGSARASAGQALDDPISDIEKPKGTPATAEVLTAQSISGESEGLLQNYADGQTFEEYLDAEVPWWTEEPHFVDWVPAGQFEEALRADTAKKVQEGEDLMQQIRDDYSGSRLACAEKPISMLGYWWHDETFKSGRSPSPLSIFDSPADNSVLGLIPPLPMRGHIGEVLEEQPQSFRNTRDPDIIEKAVTLHWESITQT